MRASQSVLLVDPLLTEIVGHHGSAGRMYPPRALAWDRFPRVDAILFTHEHEDHLDIPSLKRLAPSIPVFLPARSSSAARRILQTMGFAVSPVGPGSHLTVGDLEIDVLGADHVHQDHAEEWDVVPFLVRDRQRSGSFFSAVDVTPSLALIRELKALAPQPGIWAFTNNHADLGIQRAGAVPEHAPDPVDGMAAHWMEIYEQVTAAWGVPAAVVACGGGWAFSSDRQWLNNHVFRVESDAVLNVLRAAHPDQTFRAVLPGTTLAMEAGRVESMTDRTDFLEPLPAERWPDRSYRPTVSMLEDYEPASGRRSMCASERVELEAALDRFAGFLYGSPIFRGLYSLSGRTTRKPTLVLVLLEERDGYWLYEYDPQSCAFTRTECEDPFDAYVLGFECWASDLLDVLRADATPASIVLGRERHWNHQPDQLSFSIGSTLVKYRHPLREPQGYFRMYERMVADLPWQPLVTGALQEQALATVRELADAFATAPYAPGEAAWRDAEAALLFHYVAQQWPDAGHAAESAAAVERIFATFERARLAPSLLGGSVGMAWVLQHLGHDSLTDMDELLVTALARGDLAGRFDLAGGIGGIGAYALERGALPLLEQVVEQLRASASWSDAGASWWTPAHQLSPENAALHPEGHVDLGIPHGAAGIILMLAGATRALGGGARARAVSLLESAVGWLLAQRLPTTSIACFPKWIAAGEVPTAGRAAWCYGDPGIGAALSAAASALDHVEWARIGWEVTDRCAVRAPQATGIVDATFCHGAAGMTHLLNRSFQRTGDPALGRAARGWLERMLSMRQADAGLGGFVRVGRHAASADAGLVSGIAGIALTLLAAASPTLPGWDRLLLPSTTHANRRDDR